LRYRGDQVRGAVTVRLESPADLGTRLGIDRAQLQQRIDEEAVTLVGGHAAGRGVRLLQVAGISKVCQDLLAREYFLDYKIPTVNVRLFNTTGPGKTNDAPSDFVRQLARIKKGLQAPVLEVGNLKPRRAFLDVSDAVRGFYLAASRGKRGEAYNLCATRTYSIQEILRTAIRLCGVKVQIRPVSRLMRPSDEKIIFGSTKKIRRDTGWKPLCSLEQTLESMLEYWQAAP